jgi:hypothetical protein
MARTVLILGAGASKMAGAPLMKDFFEVAQDTERDMYQHKGWKYKYESMVEGFADVFRARKLLQPAHSTGDIDLYNLESVFAAFEMARLCGELGPLAQNEIDMLPNAIKRMIVTTLEWNIGFSSILDWPVPYGPPAGSTDSGIPQPYGAFADMVWGMAAKWTTILHYGQISIITMNYDLCCDFALHKRGIRFDYGLGEPVPHTYAKLLKLHGSLNWLHCPQCRQIVSWPMEDLLRNYPWETNDYHPPKLIVSRKIDRLEHCDVRTQSPIPVIVPPTWNKQPHYSQLNSVWRHASAALRSAENIFVFGYSLPPSDHFFRYLYALSTIGGGPPRRFWVFDPDPEGEVEKRFRDLTGTSVKRIFRFERWTFDKAITALSDELRLQHPSSPIATPYHDPSQGAT